MTRLGGVVEVLKFGIFDGRGFKDKPIEIGTLANGMTTP
jgi:hypothetical protein